MKLSCLAVLALGACASGAHAQTDNFYRVGAPTLVPRHGVGLVDASTLLEPGMSDSATSAFGYPGKRMGLEDMADARAFNVTGRERDARAHRAWGMSVAVRGGPVTYRIAHQNKNVAKVAPAMSLGNRIDAKNTIVAANLDLGLVKAYAAYSANRGWGSSPLWNPDNPYGAAMASMPSTDSRDVLVGVAVPMGRTTLLASFIRKNDRDLANRDSDQFAFGGTYTISRRTDVYAAYSLIQPRSGPGYMAGTPILASKGFSALNLGMRHSF
ncbi:MAG: porin [Pseudomonadota bacterium]